MNKDNAHLYLPLVKALAEGKTIQYNVNALGVPPCWIDVLDPFFGNVASNYRIKPEPRVRWAIYTTDGACFCTYDSKDAAGVGISNLGSPDWKIVKFVEELEG